MISIFRMLLEDYEWYSLVGHLEKQIGLKLKDFIKEEDYSKYHIMFVFISIPIIFYLPL